MDNKYDLLIKGNIVLPEKVLYNSILVIKDEKISAIFDHNTIINGRIHIDATDKFILPGMIDAHVHCYSSLDEGFTNASFSAAAGGVTTIIEMPYDATGMISTEKSFLEKKEKIDKESVVDVAMLATIDVNNGLDQIPLLAKAGACGFKVSMFNTDSFRFPRIDDGALFDVFSLISETGLPVGVHAETDEIVRNFIKKYEDRGEEDPRYHNWSRPKVAESTAVLTALELAYWTGVKLHIYHATFPRIFELVDYFRAMGTQVTAETCTHYLTLKEEDMLNLNAKGKINPPLRTSNDIEELWKQISKGVVDIITSDHAPWTLERKSNPNIFSNASGAPGVETLLPVIYSEGVAKGRISILELVKLLSEKPAAIFGLDYRKGKIKEGMDADIVILDPNQSYVLNEQEMHSSAGWSPYHNKQIQGKITHTLVRGKVIYNEGAIISSGTGRFIYGKHR